MCLHAVLYLACENQFPSSSLVNVQILGFSSVDASNAYSNVGVMHATQCYSHLEVVAALNVCGMSWCGKQTAVDYVKHSWQIAVHFTLLSMPSRHIVASDHISYLSCRQIGCPSEVARSMATMATQNEAE